MDTSETYIKMAEKAVELQEGWKPEEGDYCVWDTKEDVRLLYCNAWGELEIGSYEDENGGTGESVVRRINFDKALRTIYLPRQDQLQDMLDDRFSNRYAYVQAGKFGNEAYGLGLDSKASMEQLWLAFVMKENYGKEWNGKDWVKTK